ncbi:MAG: hypothetical protein K2O32_11105 [Acetatifactor sp.]|nr:hypothetical protein [Acetatifactor sp.]
MLKNKKSRKKFWIITIILIFLVIILSFFAKYLLTKYAEQIQSYIKRSIAAKVEASEEELIQVIAEIDSQEIPRYITLRVKDEDGIPFKELDNDKITKVFKEFSLILIKNDMDDSEGGYVVFAISSDIITHLVWGDYWYGFYYSEEDSPINIATGAKVDCNTKIYYELTSDIKYWYKTEKIIDNWWYYEEQWTFSY